MHESTTHVNRFVFDSVFSKEKTSFACSMLTVSASRNVLVKLLQNIPKPGFSFIITINEYFPKCQSVSKEGRGYRRGEPSDIATLRWFPSPKDLHVLNPKRFLTAGYAGKKSLEPKLHFNAGSACKRNLEPCKGL